MSFYRDFVASLGPEVLYWPLDATYGLADQSGEDRDGTAFGGVLVGEAASSPIAGETTATDMDGVGNDVYEASSYALSGAVTITGWASLDSTDGGGDILFGSAGGANWHALQVAGTTRNVSWFSNAAANGSWAATWPAGTGWHHWALVFSDVANTAELFIDGVSKGQVAAAQPWGAVQGVQAFGAFAGGQYWDGKMAHVAIFERALSAAEIGGLYSVGIEGAGLLTSLGSAGARRQPQVRIATEGADGVGYDVTELAEGLRWSSVNPGGDESASFTYNRPWSTDLPEISKGNKLCITHGVDVLWQGEIDETDRSGDEVEKTDVTAYGSGISLKEGSFGPMPFVDRDLNKWGPINRARRLQILSLQRPVFDPSVAPDPTTLLPALVTQIEGPWGAVAHSFAMYDAGQGAQIGSIYFAFTATATINLGDANWEWYLGVTDGDVRGESTGNLRAASEPGTTFTPPVSRRFAQIEQLYAAASASTIQYPITWVLVVYGSTGLTPLSAGGGFTADQIIEYVVAQVSDVVARQVDPQTFEIRQFVVGDDAHEDVIKAADAFEANDWGTWGPDSPLDHSGNGYFDYRDKQSNIQHWRTHRAELDSFSLHSELSSLYNRVIVNYQDSAGTTFREPPYGDDPDPRRAREDEDAHPRSRTLQSGRSANARRRLPGPVRRGGAGAGLHHAEPTDHALSPWQAAGLLRSR